MRLAGPVLVARAERSRFCVPDAPVDRARDRDRRRLGRRIVGYAFDQLRAVGHENFEGAPTAELLGVNRHIHLPGPTGAEADAGAGGQVEPDKLDVGFGVGTHAQRENARDVWQRANGKPVKMLLRRAEHLVGDPREVTAVRRHFESKKAIPAIEAAVAPEDRAAGVKQGEESVGDLRTNALHRQLEHDRLAGPGFEA